MAKIRANYSETFLVRKPRSELLTFFLEPESVARLARNVKAGAECAGATRDPIEMIAHGAFAFRREQLAERMPLEFARDAAKQGFRGPVARQDLARPMGRKLNPALRSTQFQIPDVRQ